ncbi:hypothetical protein [Cytobacillus kochii]|uniref:hypothetical protein n=1 Tax=Cytobacillus kochii TaxID=859143 RepID=UPI00402AC270
MGSKAQKTKPQDSYRHTRKELIDNAATFGVKPEIMVGALYGVEYASKEEAKKLIEAFLSKEVK